MAAEVNFSCFGNVSRENVTWSVWSLNPRVQTDTASRYTLTAILLLMLLFGLPSNTMIIAVAVKKQLYRTQPIIISLLNLAITDLLLCVLVIPVNIATLIIGEFQFGHSDYTRCQVCQTGVIFVTLILGSLNNLAIMSTDRFLYLKAPLRYSKWVTNTRIFLATLLAWVLSIAMVFPTLFGFSEMRFSTAVGICTIAFSGSTPVAKNSHYLIFLALLISLPIITLVVTNAWGAAIIHKHIRAKKKNLQRDKASDENYHKQLARQQNTLQRKFVKIYSAIFITNLLTYLPMVARMLIGVIAEDEEFSQAVRISGTLAYVALLSQAAVHPIVQTTLIGDVRRGLLAQFRMARDRVRQFSHSEIRRSDSNSTQNEKNTAHKNYSHDTKESKT